MKAVNKQPLSYPHSIELSARDSWRKGGAGKKERRGKENMIGTQGRGVRMGVQRGWGVVDIRGVLFGLGGGVVGQRQVAAEKEGV